MIRVVLVGCGAWGANLLRVLSRSSRADVVAVADPNLAKLAPAADLCPKARLVRSLDEACETRPDAAVIATPPSTHAALALQALDAGLDVFVEKPLAMTPFDADRCVARAAASARVGMVGHLLRYHPTVTRLAELVHGGELGEVHRFAAARFSITGDRTTSTLWTLGPHDLSVLCAIDPGPVALVDAMAEGAGDRVLFTLRTHRGIAARIELSRAHPTKVREIRVVGARGAAVLDDVLAPERLRLDMRSGTTVEVVPWREPLAIEMEHFLECVERRTRPLSPFEEGATVVRLLSRVHAASERPQPSFQR